jgi:hypothetical protein
MQKGQYSQHNSLQLYNKGLQRCVDPVQVIVAKCMQIFTSDRDDLFDHLCRDNVLYPVIFYFNKDLIIYAFPSYKEIIITVAYNRKTSFIYTFMEGLSKHSNRSRCLADIQKLNPEVKAYYRYRQVYSIPIEYWNMSLVFDYNRRYSKDYLEVILNGDPNVISLTPYINEELTSYMKNPCFANI